MYIHSFLYTLFFHYPLTFSFLSFCGCDVAGLLVPTSVRQRVYSVVHRIKGGRVKIAFFVNYSTVAFPLHLPTLKRQQFFGAVANSLGKNSYFPLPLDMRRCVLYYVITKIQSCQDMTIYGTVGRPAVHKQ